MSKTFLANDDSGMLIVDVSDPYYPTMLSHTYTGTSVYGISIQGNQLCLAENLDGMRLLDISNQSEPTEIGYLDTPGNTRGVFLSDSLILAAEYFSGLGIYTFSDSGGFSEIGRVNTTGATSSVQVIDTRAYIADGTGGMQVFDISEPSQPNLAGWFETNSTVRSFDINEDLLLVSDGFTGVYFLTDTFTDGIDKQMQTLPSEARLSQNYPNPFNPSTAISYGLPEDSNVTLVIYDVRGQVVQTLESGHQSAGWYDVTWNGKTADGHTISTGIYFARLVAGDCSQVIKMLYLK